MVCGVDVPPFPLLEIPPCCTLTAYSHVVIFNPLRTTAQHVDLDIDAPQLLEAANRSLLTIHVLQSNMQQVDRPENDCTVASLDEQPPPRWSVVVTTNPCSVLHAIRPLYDAMLEVEQLGVAIKERPLPAGEDLCLSGHACLCVALLPTDDDTGNTQLTHHIPELLERVSFAYAYAILLFVGPQAECTPSHLNFVRGAQHRLYAIGRSLGLAVQVLVARDVPHAQLMLRHCLVGAIADMGVTLEEVPGELTACLERAECLNPHSAAAIANSRVLQDGASLHQCIQVCSTDDRLLLLTAHTKTQALHQHPLVQVAVPTHCLEMLSVVLPFLTMDAATTQQQPSHAAPCESVPQHAQHAPLQSPLNQKRPPPGTFCCTTPQGQQWLQELGLLDSPPPPRNSPVLCITPPNRIVNSHARCTRQQHTDDFGVPLDLISELQDGPGHQSWADLRTPPSRSRRHTPMGPLGADIHSARAVPQTLQPWCPNFEQYAMPSSAGCVALHSAMVHTETRAPIHRRAEFPWAVKPTTVAPTRGRAGTPAWLQRMRRRRRH